MGEEKERCATTGFYMGQRTNWEAWSCFLPENVLGLVKKEDLIAPHSELCMSAGVAGDKILLACLHKDRREAVILTDLGEGKGCRSTHGLDNEVLPPHVIRVASELFGISKRGQ